MKKIFTICLLLSLCFQAISKQVNEYSARLVGKNFLSAKANFSAQNKTGLSMTLAYQATSPGAMAASNSTPQTLYYVYNTANGFVIVSGDDAANPILAYSNEGNFDPKKISSSVSYWLSGYQKQIQYIIDNNVQATSTIAAKWDALINNKQQPSALATNTVSPLMSTTWNQSPYYNDACPYDNVKDSFAVTGCVATAMAQVLKFWNYPATGSGFYSYNDPHFGTQSANFSSTNYAWDSMPNSVNSKNHAVATLMYQCGVSVNMNYGVDESSSYVISAASPITNCAEYALKTYFGYSNSLKGLLRSNYGDTIWIDKLEAELDAGRPVIYSGFGTEGGHCFDFDGYDANNYFHVNWGWGGLDNGYFSIDALNPSALGTGGGDGGFNSGQEAIIGIEPSNGGGSHTSTPTDSISLYDQVTLSASTIYYGHSFTAYANVQNTGTDTFKGTYCAAIFNNTNTFFDFIDSIPNVVLPPGFVYKSDISFTYGGSLTMLPGKYSISIFYHGIGKSWKLVTNAGSYINYAQLSVINPGTLEMYSAMNVTPGTTLIADQSVSVNLDITNTSSTTFTGVYDLSLYNLDGTHAATIQTLTGQSLPYNDHYSGGLTFSTTSLNVSPGTYLMAMQFEASGSSTSSLTGSTNYPNPIKVIVQAPPLNPDIYEPDNTFSTAYSLPVTFSNNVADVNTAGSNCNVGTDYDYYKIDLASGASYTISGRIDDAEGSGNSNTYTLNGEFSYSTDGGTTWSGPYDGVLPNNISLSNGGTVYFLVSPAFSGQTGTYLLDMNVVKTLSPDVYEPDNTLSTAYSLPVSFSGSLAEVSTPGSNINVGTDVDYYKIVLDPADAYTISPRIDDAQGSGNANTYTLNGQFSYSLDGGNTWSGPYTGTTPSNINLNHGTTVYFYVTPTSNTQTGTYLLDMTISKSISGIEVPYDDSKINVYPNPAREILNVDLSGYNGSVNKISLFTIEGKELYSNTEIQSSKINAIPVNMLSEGAYVLSLQTSEGVINNKIMIQR